MTAINQNQLLTNPLFDLDPDGPRLFVWTVDQYLGLVDEGLLSEDDRTELLGGNIVYKMPAKKPHDTIVSYLQDYFIDKYHKQYTLRSERGLKLSATDMPEPDYVVAIYRKDKYLHVWPTVPDVLLVVEVADSTLASDRKYKHKLYAAYGIPEYWIVNIPDQQIELYLEPDQQKREYVQVTEHPRGSIFQSPFVGEVVVNEIIPDNLLEGEE